MNSILELLLHHRDEEVRMLALKIASNYAESEHSNVGALAEVQASHELRHVW